MPHCHNSDACTNTYIRTEQYSFKLVHLSTACDGDVCFFFFKEKKEKKKWEVLKQQVEFASSHKKKL